MVNFTVMKDEITKEYECRPSETILQFKEKIHKDFELEKNEYVDLEFVLEKPLRVLGKFNVEPGIIPRTMDRYTLERYAFGDKNIQTTFHIVQNFKQPIVKKQRGKLLGAYKAPVGEMKSGDSVGVPHQFNVPNFDITSTDDFPSL